MTIQNIEDVMDRIMSLNRNLNEESLKTLLSASGWDREDISEGLRIFRLTNKNSVTSTPIVVSKSVNLDTRDTDTRPQVANPEPPIHNTYTFNLKKTDPSSEVKNISVTSSQDVKLESAVESKEGSVSISSPSVDTSKDTKAQTESKVVGVDISNNEFLNKKETGVGVEETLDNDKKNHLLGKILFYLILLLILGAFLAYLFIPPFTSFISKNILGRQASLSTQSVNTLSTNQTSKQQSQQTLGSTVPLPTKTDQNMVDTNNINNIATNSNIYLDINDIRKELQALKAEVASYKNAYTGSNNVQTQTIVKYISQKGARGATGTAGRGIVGVSATTSGFIINYTDGTRDVVPYSTTTIVNILNSKSVCFRDQNASTTSASDVCLDRNAVLNLINK